MSLFVKCTVLLTIRFFSFSDILATSWLRISTGGGIFLLIVSDLQRIRLFEKSAECLTYEDGRVSCFVKRDSFDLYWATR